jgi:Putative beta-barrel porin-2, OmpL-like. bbp2
MNSMILLTALTVGQPGGGFPTTPAGAFPLTSRPAAGQPAQLPATTTQPTATQPPPAKNGNGNGNGNGDCKECEPEKEAPEPWALMRVLKGTAFGDRLDQHGVVISGWTQGNYTLSTASRSNLPITFNDRADFWQMNQNFLRVDKAIDTSKKEFQWGGRTEWILPGTDARFTPARNLLDTQTGDYRIDLIQAYVDMFFPNVGPEGTTLRTGKFATHCSYELMQGAETPFLSRSYTFQYNPFTHTGVWAITPLNDTWTISNGIALGSDNFIGAPSRVMYIGQLKWAPPEGKTNAVFNVCVTNPRFDVDDNFPFYNHYGLVLTHKFTDKFTYAIDTAFAHMDGVPDVGSATWYGAANYGIYQINDKLSTTLRAEVFEDTKGVRTGFSGLYTEVTYGFAYAPKPGLILRPAVRYDHNNNSAPFEGKANLFTAAMDVIIRW